MAHTKEHHSAATEKRKKKNASHKQMPQPPNDSTMPRQPTIAQPRILTSDNPSDAFRAGHGISKLDILAAAAESRHYSQSQTTEGYTIANTTNDTERHPTHSDAVDKVQLPLDTSTNETLHLPPIHTITSTNEKLHLPSIRTITSSLPASGSASSPISISSSPASTPAPIAAAPGPAPPSVISSTSILPPAPPTIISSTSIFPPSWKPVPKNNISLTTALDHPVTHKISLPPPQESVHLTCGNGWGRKYAVLPTGFGGLGLARGEEEGARDELFWRAGFVGWEQTLEMARYWRTRQERKKGGEEVVREVENWKKRHVERWQGRD
ncbi:hypothetical protein AC578_3855 [Pseudocercospora eumusae]|uniref:Uncharacterized protein n=1 Tax=Pseudocercospora eumusae TaxID=321146 RepID=A0A139GX03_9PEZI|nr:hypothetical protein AC578_3855 [Pseudocercospora eumusae]